MANFSDAVMECLDTPDFVKEFNILTGCNIGVDDRTAIEVAIDKATGHDPHEKDYRRFIDFVFEYIWLPLVDSGDVVDGEVVSDEME